jgi:hypothetical protein
VALVSTTSDINTAWNYRGWLFSIDVVSNTNRSTSTTLT